MKTNKFLCTLTIFILIINIFAVYISATAEITVTLNESPISFDQPPIIQNDRTLVPMRAIFEALGAEVHWISEINVIIAFKGQSVILMRIDEKELYVTDASEFDTIDVLSQKINEASFTSEGITFLEAHEFDVVPQIIGGRTLIPVRSVSEALGITVDWDEKNAVVELICSDDFINMPNKDKSFIDEIVHFYNVTLSEAYKSHQGGYIDSENEYVIKPDFNFEFDYKTIAGGGSSGLAIKEDNSLWAWGECILPLGEWPNPQGMLLREEYGDDLLTPVKFMDDVLTVSAGNSHCISVKTDGSLWIWGSNVYGQIGNGTVSKYIPFFGTFPIWVSGNDSPVPINIMSDVAYVAAGGLHSLAVKTDGSLWTWGYNNYGQLGNGTEIYSLKPHKIMDDVISVAAGYYHSLALKADGSLFSFGEGGSGQLGNGISAFNGEADLANSNVPEKIMDDVAYIAAGYASSAAVKTDGSLWVFGSDLQADSDKSIPTKVMDDVIAADVANGYVLALKADGSLWAFGRNWYGLFGNDITESRTPVKIMDDVTCISSGLHVDSLAVKTDGSLWALGGRFEEKSNSTIIEKEQLKILDGIILK